jgi:hypothetical protein
MSSCYLGSRRFPSLFCLCQLPGRAGPEHPHTDRNSDNSINPVTGHAPKGAVVMIGYVVSSIEVPNLVEAETLLPTSSASLRCVPLDSFSERGSGIHLPTNDWAIYATTLATSLHALHILVPTPTSRSQSEDKHSQVPDSNPSHGERLKSSFPLRNRTCFEPLSKSLRAKPTLQDPLSANLQLPFYIS